MRQSDNLSIKFFPYNLTYMFFKIKLFRYLSMTNCDLYQIGEEFSPKPYAVAMPKGSPLKKRIDEA